MGMDTLEVLRNRKADIERLANAHGAHGVRVFGSVARGEDTDASDIDFLVEMDADRSLLDLIGLQQDLEALLNRPTDVISNGGINPRLRQRILAEAITL